MSGWFGDILELIGDGISIMWEKTAGKAIDILSDAIWDAMFEWVFKLIYGAISELFEFINESTSDIFSLAWVNSFIRLFHNMGWILFACGLIVAVFDCAVAYESGQNNIKNTAVNILKGYFAANLVAVVPQRLYSFCTSLQGTFATELLGSFVGDTSDTVAGTGLKVILALAEDVSLFSLFFIILFGYCTVKVVLANIKRGGILLCQIAIGSLYMFSVPRGYTDGFYNWCKQVIATCLTAFLQTTILFIGLLTYTQHALLAVGICLSANEIPRIAQTFGLDASIKLNITSISSAVSMTSKASRYLRGGHI